MKRKQWSCLPILLGLALLLSGCDFFSHRQPDADPDESWISQAPQMSFGWDDARETFCGTLVIDGASMPIEVGFRSRIMDVISDDGALTETVLFLGRCDFGENEISVTVTHDHAGLFGETLPTITFERHVKQEDGPSVSPDMT